jgi:ABC-type uncharacterized transport system permease subunit
LFEAALGAFSVATVLHAVSLVERWRAIGHLPVDNFFETSSMCALLLALAFLFLYRRYQFAPLSVFLFPLVFLLSLAGAMEIPVAGWADSRVRDAWLLVHVAMVMLAYAALAVMALASFFYLMQERNLKSKQSGGLFERLPPLGTLDNLITKTMGLGFALLTLATIAGSTWAFVESGTKWIGDAKIGISLFTWGLTLVMVFLRTSAGWRGRKAALLALTVIGCSALTWAAHIGLRGTLTR